MLTQERLKEILHYYDEFGIFVWKNKIRKGIQIGDTAGSKHGVGYWSIGINGKHYLAHRLLVPSRLLKKQPLLI